MKSSQDWVKSTPILQADKQASNRELVALIKDVQLDALWEARDNAEGQSWLRINKLMTDLRQDMDTTDASFDT